MYLARHGQTEENISRIFQGHLPGHLTAEGRCQAVALGEKLKGVPLNAVVSSDLQRVTDTVCRAVGWRHLPWEQTPLLREIDWGSWTGLPVGSVDRSRLPEDAETREMLYARAGQCVGYLRARYEGRCVLVVAHGQVNRCLRAQAEGIPLSRLSEVPLMRNGEVVRLAL